MDGRIMYVLNLNQRRLVVVCVLLSGLLGTSFGLGIVLGMRSSTAKPNYTSAQLVGTENSPRSNNLLPATMDRTAIKEPSSRSIEEKIVSPDTAIRESLRVATPTKKRPISNSKKTKPATRVVPRNLAGYKPSLNIQLFVTKDLKRIRLLESELKKKNYRAGIVPVGKGTYALKIGPYSNKGEAEADLQLFRNKTSFSDAFIRVAYHKE